MSARANQKQYPLAFEPEKLNPNIFKASVLRQFPKSSVLSEAIFK